MNESKQPHSPISKTKQTRRKFIGTTAAAAGAAIAAPTIIPSSALGLGDSVAPSERIVFGGIGIRNRGRYDLRFLLKYPDIQFVAICDLRRDSREVCKKMVDEHYGNKDMKMYKDLREFLPERTDIDAILTAPGDRWHALAAIMAMRAGKDVYSEKPSSMTIQEGQAVVDTAKRFGRVYQTGTQRMNERHYVFCNELLRRGYLGNVHTVRAHTAPWVGVVMDHDWLPEEPLPDKEEIDWDIWLGPTPWRPYNKQYVDGKWRGYYDWHTSDIGEWGAHTISQCQLGIGATDTSPVEYYPVEDTSADHMETKFANGIKMILNLDKEKQIWRGSCGVKYEGDEGWCAVADAYEKPDVSNEKWLEDYDRIIDEYEQETGRPIKAPDVPMTDFSMNHLRDFVNCVKTREQPVANPEVMHRSMTAVHAANIAMWLQREMQFDPVKQEFVNDPEANRMRSRAQREPWVL